MKTITLISAIILLLQPSTAKEMSSEFELFFKVIGIPEKAIEADEFDSQKELEKLFPNQSSYRDVLAKLGLATRRLAFGNMILTSQHDDLFISEESENNAHVLIASILIEDGEQTTSYNLHLRFDPDDTLYARGITFSSDDLYGSPATTRQLEMTADDYESVLIPQPKYN